MGSKLLRNPVGEHNYKRIFNGLRPVFLLSLPEGLHSLTLRRREL